MYNLFSFFFSNCVCVACVALNTFPNQIFPKIFSQMHENGVTSILKCNQICIRFNYVDFSKSVSEYSFIEIIFEKKRLEILKNENLVSISFMLLLLFNSDEMLLFYMASVKVFFSLEHFCNFMNSNDSHH